jgi:orotate phosphoribosyltransferase
MELIPTRREVIDLLRQTGALRNGHFRYPNGLHSDQYLQVALAMRYYQNARTLGVALSRKIRGNPELHALIAELSIVAPATGGLPVAFSVCEALRARQVYWAEQDAPNAPWHFRQFMGTRPGEMVLLVDDVMRSGKRVTALKKLVEDEGGEVVGIAVMIHQPNPGSPDFAPLPFLQLATLDTMYYNDGLSCELCQARVPLEEIWV